MAEAVYVAGIGRMWLRLVVAGFGWLSGWLAWFVVRLTGFGLYVTSFGLVAWLIGCFVAWFIGCLRSHGCKCSHTDKRLARLPRRFTCTHTNTHTTQDFIDQSIPLEASADGWTQSALRQSDASGRKLGDRESR